MLLHICCFIDIVSYFVSDFVLFLQNVFCSEIKLEWTDRTQTSIDIRRAVFRPEDFQNQTFSCHGLQIDMHLAAEHHLKIFCDIL